MEVNSNRTSPSRHVSTEQYAFSKMTDKKEVPRLERSISQCMDVFQVTDPNHGSSLLQGLQKSFKDQRYCDVTLDIGKKRKLRAHRVVLSSFSCYFEALFRTNWEDGKQDEVEIRGFDEHELNNLIEFAYSGSIDISTGNVQTLLEAANYLGVEFVQNSCVEFLKKAIDDKNCLGLLHLADVFALDELKRVAKRHFLRNFTEVCKAEEFLSLSYDLLIELLKDDDLCVVIEGLIPSVEEREKIVLQAVIQYVEHDMVTRKERLPELLSLVRLPTCYFQEINTHKLVVNHCADIFTKSGKLKSEMEDDIHCQLVTTWTSPRPRGKFVLVWGFPLGKRDLSREVSCFPGTVKEVEENLKNDVYVGGMKLWVQCLELPVVSGLKVFFSDSREAMYGSDKADKVYEFHLKENEKIIRADAQFSYLVNELTFYTNKCAADGSAREFGPYGGEGHGAFHSSPPSGSYSYLVGVSGAVVTTPAGFGITRLQFAWKQFVFPGDPEPVTGRCRVAGEDDFDDDDDDDDDDIDIDSDDDVVVDDDDDDSDFDWHELFGDEDAPPLGFAPYMFEPLA